LLASDKELPIMSLSGDAIFILTYCLFLTGAAWSFQRNAPAISIWVMSIAVFIDFLASILPVMNVKSIAINMPSSIIITAAIFLGILVWLLFLFALFAWKIKRLRLFHFLILEIQIVWFIDNILLLYGTYKVPFK
jgi:hypothetical protein